MGWRIRAAKSPAISLRVSGIWLAACVDVCSVTAAMVRNAVASMARVVHRYQEAQRDLMFIQAGQALGGLEVLLRSPPLAGDLDQDREGDVAGCVAAVERQFPGGAVAADQQPVAAGLARGDADPGPVVVPVAFGALPGGIPLPR